MRQRQNQAAASGFRSSDEHSSNFDLRDTLAATEVRELSFAEFRALLENSGKTRA